MTPGCILQLAAPIGLSPLTLAPSLNPFPPQWCPPAPHHLCPPSAYLVDLYLPTHPSFLLVACGNGAPGLSPFHCSLSGPHSGGQRPDWPGASKWTPHIGSGGTLPSCPFWAPGCLLAGSLPRGRHIPFNLPFLSLSPPCGIMCLHPGPQPSPLGPSCAYRVSIPWHGRHPG